jgi:hypothetical protein
LTGILDDYNGEDENNGKVHCSVLFCAVLCRVVHAPGGRQQSFRKFMQHPHPINYRKYQQLTAKKQANAN